MSLDAAQFMKPRRSVLYMPGATVRAMEKARTLDADVLIIDLEDAVSYGFGVFNYPSGYGFQVPFVAQTRREAGIGTMAVGLIVDPHQTETVAASGQADSVALGHSALRDPHFPLHAQRTLGAADPQSPHADWNIQAGWWLNARESRLQRLGPRASVEERVAEMSGA